MGVEVAVSLTDSKVNDLLARHAAFWARGVASKPLFARASIAYDSRTGMFYRPDLPLEGRFTPEMICTADVVEHARRWFAHVGVTVGDAFRLAVPSSTVPWLEAMLGCPIYYSFTHDTMWAEKPASAPWPPPLPDLDKDPWFDKLVELTVAFDEAIGGQYPAGTLHLRGAADLLGAYLGPSELCMAVHDAPGALRIAVERTAALCIQVLRAQLGALRPFRGGYFNFFEVWAPGTTAVWSQDLASLFSPSMYRDAFLFFDQAVAEAIDYPVLHTHSSEAHCLELWSEVEGLTLQVTTDPTGTALAEILPLLATLQPRMPMMLHVQDEAELRLVERSLQPQGLEIATRFQPGRPSVFEEEQMWAS